MSAWHTIYTKENVTIEDAQKIVNEFPDNWFMFDFGKGRRDEKPIRQDWGWSAMADVWNPSHNWNDEDYGLGIVGTWTIGGSGTTVVNFVENKLKELGYTVLKITFSD